MADTDTVVSMNKKLRVLVVGCGYFGEKRILACTRLKKYISLVGVVDTDKKRAEKIGASLHIPYASSIQKFLQSKQADMAIVAVPNSCHATVVCEALKNGLHVLCEKPLTTTVRDAKKIVRAAKKYTRFVKTGSNHRFFPTIQKASELIHKGKIGRVLCIHGNIGTNGSHTQHSWFWNKKISGGGTFIDNASHIIDIARWFMGNFYTCIGSTANTYWKQTDVEDVAAGIYKTKDGRMATITSSWTQWTGYLNIEIWGDKGYILINSKKEHTVIFGTNTSGKQKIYDFSNTPVSSYEDELLYFTSCIHNRKEPKPNAEDGAKVIRMIEAVYISAKQKKLIYLV